MPNTLPETVFFSGSAVELQRVGIIDAQGAYGLRADGTTDDAPALQAAVNAQQALGGTIVLPAGTVLLNDTIVPGPWPADSPTRTLVIQGAGMFNTTLKMSTALFALFGYGNHGVNPVIAQLVLRDLTLDGNYVGQGGTIAQNGGVALLALITPFQAVNSQTGPNGVFHHLERVRFYRPAGYVTQPSNSLHLSHCLFDRCGQPELSTGSTHYDNLGSGDWTEAIVRGCSWTNSSGNYADFVGATNGKPCRLTFTHNVSRNHQIGGIYAAGVRSVITHNKLENANAGSGVGYDAACHANNRANNIVAHNVFTNIQVLASGLAASTGDRVYSNIASDQPTGAGTVTPGASPWTYTAGASPEILHLRGGTVSLIVKNSITLYTATPAAVPLEPGEQVTVTYSVVPTAAADKK